VGGSQRRGASPGPVVRAARGCSTSFRTPLTVSAPAGSSRGAVTSAAGRGVQPEGQASPEGLTATAAHNRARSAGLAVQPSTPVPSPTFHPARPVDLIAAFAVNASHDTAATGIATDVRATAVDAPTSAAASRRPRRVPTSTSLQATTAVQATPCRKPIGCGPQSGSTDRTQSAHNRKD
jgi:hypothetical protein